MKFFNLKAVGILMLILFCGSATMAQNVVHSFVSSSTDDMEEYLADGTHDVASSDLELVQENVSDNTTKQIVGLRFSDVKIPAGAIIVSARIQFTYDNNKTLDPCKLYIKAENSTNPQTFSDTAKYELIKRAKLGDSVVWDVPSWSGGSTGTRGAAQLSSDFGALVQQIVNLSTWQSGNAMAFYLTGEGTREAESYDGAEGHSNLSYAPELIVEYYTPTLFSRNVNSSTDDMEEYLLDGVHDIASSDLELVQENTSDSTTKQIVGLRFNDISIPQGATVLHAYLQFTYDNSKSLDPCELVIRAEDASNPVTFTDTTKFELVNRPKMKESINWTVPSWSGGKTGTRGDAQKSSDIGSLVQKLVNRSDWAKGNSMAFYLTGTGTREAESFDGAEGHSNPGYAPELIIEYLGSEKPLAPIGTFPIDTGSIWNYYAGANSPGANWTSVQFNDSNWNFSSAQFGYGDGDESTVLPFGANSSDKWPVYYFRHKFNYNPNSYGVDSLIFNVKRDDGIVVYLNGTEQFRDNMPSGTINDGTLALAAVGGSDEEKFFRFAVPASSLSSGLNVLAVSVHQNAVSSSDLSFDMMVGEKKPALPAANIPFGKGSLWSFWDQGSVDANWNQTSFDSRHWDYGAGPLGYGDPVATTVGFGPNAGNKYISTWFRKPVTVADLSALPDTLAFNIRRDDGVIVYVNGTEIIRDNLPSGIISDNTWASSIIDGANESTYNTFLIPKSVFIAGENVIAVRVHQRDGTSSDINFDMEISTPPVAPKAASGCKDPGDTHISCFTSVSPLGARPTGLILPETHVFQRVLEQGDAYTRIPVGVPFTTAPGSNDFTAFIGKNGSSTEGIITVNHETTPGGVTILDARYDAAAHLWIIDSIVPVNFYTSDLVGTSRNCSGGITPWGTVVTAEETFVSGDANGDGYMDFGWLVEIDPWTKQVKQYGKGKSEKLWAMGRMSHENVAFKPDSITAYYAEDGGTSCVYKFVANAKTDFSSGKLYVLKLNNPLSGGNPTGTSAIWVEVPNATVSDRNSTNSIAAALGGTGFSGPEDVEFNAADGMIYFTSKGFGRTYRFTDHGSNVSHFETFVGGSSYVINYGTGTAVESWGTGNDNLVVDDRGNVWVLQDGSNDHIWMVTPNHSQAKPDVLLFARTPAGSEPCGFERTPDNKFGFLSIQSPSGSNSVTYQIDASGDTVYFDKSTTVVVARKEFLGDTHTGSTGNLNQPLKAVVYPNPTSGKLAVSIELENPSLVEGFIVDLQGRLVFAFNNRLNSGRHELNIDLNSAGISDGMYMLSLRAGNKMSQLTIVLNR